MTVNDGHWNKYVKGYAADIIEGKLPLGDALFKAEYIYKEYESAIWDFLEEIGVVHPPDNDDHYRLQDTSFDEYDRSIELIDCEEGFTLTSEQDKAIRNLGFDIIFVNYKAGPHIYGNKTAAMDAMPVIKDE